MNKKNVHPVLQGRGLHPVPRRPRLERASHAEGGGAGACFECHDKTPFERKNVHKVLSDKGCTACHVAHASDERALLVKAEVALCQSCHSSAAADSRRRTRITCRRLYALPRSAQLRREEAPQVVGPQPGRGGRVQLLPRLREVPEAVRAVREGRRAVRGLPRSEGRHRWARGRPQAGERR